MSHLYVCVSAHGFGHLAQLSPVIAEFRRRLPALRITLQGTISSAFAEACLPFAFTQISEPADVGMPMDNPLDTRWAQAVDSYQVFCEHQAEHLRRQRELLSQDLPDLVLSNVAWLPLQAARELDCPAVALCSLNWLDILRHGPLGNKLSPLVVESLTAGYQAADCFIRPTPAMPMNWLDNGLEVGPIARQGRSLAPQLRVRLSLPADCRLVMYQLGGIGGEVSQSALPRMPGVHWLLPGGCVGREDCSSIAELGMPFIDVLASCDLLLTKPGYGSIAEAACNGIPVLYVTRYDWPEESFLLDWLVQQLPTAEIDREEFSSGRFSQQVKHLLSVPRPEPVAPTGIGEAVDHLMRYL